MTPPERRSARALQLGIGVAITLALIWWVFHQVNFADAWSTIRTVRIVPMVLAVVLATVPFALRVPRWQLLLRRPDGTVLPAAPLWHATAIGFAANNVLPFRAGEVLRVGAVSRLARVPFAAALSSVAVERVVDALTIITLLACGLIAADFPHTVTLGGATPVTVLAERTGVFCVLALLLAIAAAWQREFTIRLLRRLLPSGRVGDALVQFVDHILSGLSALREPRRGALVIGWSLVIWVVNAAGFFLAFRAFNLPVPFSGALILQGALMIGIALPSTPGYAFVFESAIVVALALYGIAAGPAFAYAVTYHITTFIPITALGAWSAVRTGTHLRVPAAAP